jgi:hypothetical protein
MAQEEIIIFKEIGYEEIIVGSDGAAYGDGDDGGVRAEWALRND